MNFLRKYRPVTLSEYSEMGTVSNIEKVLPKKDGTSGIILLSGDSGCGKTVLGEILAKYYLCDQNEDSTDVCNICATCNKFNELSASGNLDTMPNFSHMDITSLNSKSELDKFISSLAEDNKEGGRQVILLDDIDLFSEGVQKQLAESLSTISDNKLVILNTCSESNLIQPLLYSCTSHTVINSISKDNSYKLVEKICFKEGKSFTIDAIKLLVSKTPSSIRAILLALEQILSSVECLDSKAVLDFYECEK